MVMDYPVYELKKNPTKTNCRFTCSLPDYARDNYVGEKILYINVILNWEDLWEMYMEDKGGIDSFVGFKRRETNKPEPSELLDLAGDINSYRGLV